MVQRKGERGMCKHRTYAAIRRRCDAVILVLGLCVLIMPGLLIIAMSENERLSAQICELKHNIQEYEILTDTLKSELKEVRE